MLLNRLRDMATGQSMTVESTAKTSGTTQSYGTQETPTAFGHSASESSPSLASASLGDFYLKGQNGPENSSGLFGPQQKEVTKGSSTNSQEGSDRGTSVPPIPTVQSSKSPAPFLPTKDSMRRQKEEKTTSQALHLSRVTTPKGKLHQESTTDVHPLKNIYRSNSAGSTPQNPGGPAPQTDPLGRPSKSWISRNKSDSGLIREEIKINNPSVPQAQNPHPNTSSHNQTPAHRSVGQQQTPPTPISHLPTVTNQNIPFHKASSSSSQTSSQYPAYPTKPPTFNSTHAEVQSSLREQTSPQTTTPRDSFYETKHSPSQTSQTQSFGQKQTQTLGTPPTFLTQRVYPPPTLGNAKKVNPSTPNVEIAKANAASTPSVPPLSSFDSLLYSTTSTVSTTSLDHPRLTTSPNPPGRSTVASKQEFLSHESISLAPTTRNRPKTSPALSSLPSPSPISTPPQIPFVRPSSSSYILASSFKPPLDSSHDPSSVQVRMTSSTTSQYVTPSSFWTGSPATISPTPSSRVTKHSFFPALPHSSSSITTSTPSTSSVGSVPTTSLSMYSGSTSPDPAPSQVHRRALSQPFTSTSSSAPSQQLTEGQGLLIQSPSAPSESQPKLKNIPTPTMMVHPNPEPYPNFDPHLKANINEIEPNPPNTDTETEHPTNPARTPGRDGKYPGVVPRRTSWELGMLLGCSAGLGMVLVVGLRYIYSQACGKRTGVTLNDREREHARGERGLIHVQECGDLVRVRRIRDNSFVLLAEYDILGSPGD